MTKQSDQAQQHALHLVDGLIAHCKAHAIPCMAAIGVGDRHFASRGVITNGLDLIDLMITMATDGRDLATKNGRDAIAMLLEHIAQTIKDATETESVTTRSQ